jgi:ADP-heptose:LPS heptosyltransferase
MFRKLIHSVRELRELRRDLRNCPEHFQGLVRRFPRNAARLAGLRARARLTGRRLIVIALAERLGDIVACEPMIRHLRALHPNALIVWAGRSPYLDMVRYHPQLDGVIPLHCITEWNWLRNLPLFDLVCDLHISGKFCGACREKRHLKKDGPNANISIYSYYRFGSLIESFSRSADMPVTRAEQPKLYLAPGTQADVDRFELPERFVTIHAQSEEANRNWTKDGWNALIDHIHQTYGLPVVELGMQSELGRAEGAGYLNFCGRCSLAESAEVIRRSSFFVGIDSGPAHLANAMGTPGLILLGHYRIFRQYLPYSGQYADEGQPSVIQHDGPVSELPVDVCLGRVDERLASLAPRTAALAEKP